MNKKTGYNISLSPAFLGESPEAKPPEADILKPLSCLLWNLGFYEKILLAFQFLTIIPVKVKGDISEKEISRS